MVGREIGEYREQGLVEGERHPAGRSRMAPWNGEEWGSPAPMLSLLTSSAGDNRCGGLGRRHGQACCLSCCNFSSFLRSIGRRTCAIRSFFPTQQLS